MLSSKWVMIPSIYELNNTIVDAWYEHIMESKQVGISNGIPLHKTENKNSDKHSGIHPSICVQSVGYAHYYQPKLVSALSLEHLTWLVQH